MDTAHDGLDQGGPGAQKSRSRLCCSHMLKAGGGGVCLVALAAALLAGVQAPRPHSGRARVSIGIWNLVTGSGLGSRTQP